jgi:hypothetical protein
VSSLRAALWRAAHRRVEPARRPLVLAHRLECLLIAVSSLLAALERLLADV